MPLQHIKRLQMVFDFANGSFPMLKLPTGFRYVAWRPEMLEIHADIKHRGFRNDLDARIFPTFRNYKQCVNLMQSISASPAFLPAATLLIANGDEHDLFEYVACIQGMRFSGEVGAVQNIAVLPDYRGRGIGRAILLGSLLGFRQHGIRRVTLEVTAENKPAVQLYTHVGFKTFNVHFLKIFE
ncbi:MAG: GNAT family N-acetyltransferase [Planctomycetaceae bacterium]|jgi:ribosomal protein S18 acetylase RimI-like enzyme|nr:GNAT family N-acetyltransferase [Planctomycetaceae bacterium]